MSDKVIPMCRYALQATWKRLLKGHVSPVKHGLYYYQESVTTVEAHILTDRQTLDKVIPMCRYASQATQKGLSQKSCMPKINALFINTSQKIWARLKVLWQTDGQRDRWMSFNILHVSPTPAFVIAGNKYCFQGSSLLRSVNFDLYAGNLTDKLNMKAKSLLDQKLWLRWKFLSLQMQWVWHQLCRHSFCKLKWVE